MSTQTTERPWRPATVLVRGGSTRTECHETSEALFLTSGFVYDNAAQAEATFAGTEQHWVYSRFGNPTVAMLEARLAQIEEPVDTLGGLTFLLAEGVPPVGTMLAHESGWRIEVLEADDTHVRRLRLHAPAEERPEDREE